MCQQPANLVSGLCCAAETFSTGNNAIRYQALSSRPHPMAGALDALVPPLVCRDIPAAASLAFSVRALHDSTACDAHAKQQCSELACSGHLARVSLHESFQLSRCWLHPALQTAGFRRLGSNAGVPSVMGGEAHCADASICGSSKPVSSLPLHTHTSLEKQSVSHETHSLCLRIHALATTPCFCGAVYSRCPWTGPSSPLRTLIVKHSIQRPTSTRRLKSAAV